MENDDNKGDKKAPEECEDFQSEANSLPCLKLTRLVPANKFSDSLEFTHVQPDHNDVESKRNQEDLLRFLDNSDPVIGPGPGIQGLDSVLKSFEEEILVPTQAMPPVISTGFSETRPDLGFLFEASDDELGLPPRFSSVEQGQRFGTVDPKEIVELGGDGIEEMMGNEFPVPGYDSLEFGIGGDSVANNSNHSNSGDFVALGGLFEPDGGNFGAYVVT